MSAIAGLWRRDGRPDAARSVARMQNAQSLYGPDRAAVLDLGDVAMGVRQMRLLPEDRFDHQPLDGGGGRFALVADLRLDNREHLADILGVARSDLATMADATMLMLAWERWQDDVVLHLAGDFAFAVWDGTRRRLFLARDPMGARPLHFHAGADWFAFASMPKGLLALPDIPAGPDLGHMERFALGLPETGPGTFFAGASRIAPGQRGWLKADGRWHAEPYWHERDISPCRLADPRDYAEAMRDALVKAVRVRLRSVGAIGTHLSSGYDSSAVTATAARLLAEQGRELHAFTHVPRPGCIGAIPHGRLADEGDAAAATAALYPNIRHHRLAGDDTRITELFGRLHYAMDRPIVNPINMLWVHQIADQARALGVRTVLEGGRGNATISYDGRHGPAELLAQGRIIAGLRLLAQVAHRGRRPFAYYAAQAFGPFLPPLLWHAAHRLAGRRASDICEFFPVDPKQLDHPADLERAPRPARDGRAARAAVMAHMDFATINKGFLGVFGLYRLDPTADFDLVRLCLSIPSEAYCHDGGDRVPFRHAFAGWIPDAVLDLRCRGFQAADWRHSLAQDAEEIAKRLARLADLPEIAAVLDVNDLVQLAEAVNSETLATAPSPERYKSRLARGVAWADFIARALGSNA